MQDELQRRLIDEFPTFFRDHGGDPQKTCMAWGCAVGDGWFKLLWDTCEKLRPLVGPDFKFEQIKEKFGLLRIYASGGNEESYKVLNAAEEASAYICEDCGSADGTETNSGGFGWITTKCADCREQYKKEHEAKYGRKEK